MRVGDVVDEHDTSNQGIYHCHHHHTVDFLPARIRRCVFRVFGLAETEMNLAENIRPKLHAVTPAAPAGLGRREFRTGL